MIFDKRSMMLAVVFLLLNIAQHAFAGELPKEFTVVAPEIPPLIYRDGNTTKGMLKNSFAKVEKKYGIKINIQVMNWARAIRFVKNSEFDALMPTILTEERLAFLKFPTQPLINFKGSLLVKLKASPNASQTELRSILKGNRVVKVRSMALGSHFDQAINSNEDIHLIEVASVKNAFNMLEKGRADYLAIDSLIAIHLLDIMNLNHLFEFAYIEETTNPSYLAFSEKFASKYDINQLVSLINSVNDPNHYVNKLTKQ